MYNSELWTITKKIETSIDVFHRKLLRTIIGRHYPNNISNEKLYKITKETPWIEIIRLRRLSWLGHLLRLDDQTPCNLALKYYNKNVGKNRQGNKLTWIKQINKDLQHIGLNFSIFDTGVKTLAAERKTWRKLTTLKPCRRVDESTLVRHR